MVIGPRGEQSAIILLNRYGSKLPPPKLLFLYTLIGSSFNPHQRSTVFPYMELFDKSYSQKLENLMRIRIFRMLGTKWNIPITSPGLKTQKPLREREGQDCKS